MQPVHWLQMNPLNSAQLGEHLLPFPKLHASPYSSAGMRSSVWMRRGTHTDTHADARDQYIIFRVLYDSREM